MACARLGIPFHSSTIFRDRYENMMTKTKNINPVRKKSFLAVSPNLNPKLQRKNRVERQNAPTLIFTKY
jgi:hypothetical protein